MFIIYAIDFRIFIFHNLKKKRIVAQQYGKCLKYWSLSHKSIKFKFTKQYGKLN